MRISDWSSDVCSSDLENDRIACALDPDHAGRHEVAADAGRDVLGGESAVEVLPLPPAGKLVHALIADRRNVRSPRGLLLDHLGVGVAEHTPTRQPAPEKRTDLAEADIPSSTTPRAGPVVGGDGRGSQVWPTPT